MSDKNAVSDALGIPFPASAIQTHPQTKLKYVAGHTYIHRLNDATSNTWDWRIVRQDFHPYGATGKGNARLLITVIGELTIPGLGTRAGMGVQVVTADTGGEDMWKGAMTDAIKSAAKLFGVGLELYGPDYEAGEIASAPVSRQDRSGRDEPHHPAPGPGNASPKQLGMIRGLARQKGIADDRLEARCSQLYNTALANLSKRDASDLIDRLNAVPDPSPTADDTDPHNDSGSADLLEAFNRSDLAAKHRS